VAASRAASFSNAFGLAMQTCRNFGTISQYTGVLPFFAASPQTARTLNLQPLLRSGLAALPELRI
jgi:hypothetical protein